MLCWWSGAESPGTEDVKRDHGLSDSGCISDNHADRTNGSLGQSTTEKVTMS